MTKDANGLIPVKDFIEQAKDRGIYLGKGDPNERLRYYIKTGLLPHQVRLQPQKGVDYTIGHLPTYALDLLAKIEELKAQKKAIEEIKEIVSRDQITLEAQRVDQPVIVFNHNSLRSSFALSGAAFLALTIAVFYTPLGINIKTKLDGYLSSLLPKSAIESSAPDGDVLGRIANPQLASNLSGQVSENMVINSSFEGGNLNSEPKFWSYTSDATVGNTVVSIESVHTGTQAVKVSDQFASKSNIINPGLAQSGITTINGRDYILSVFVRTRNLKGSPKLRLGFMGTVDSGDPNKNASDFSSYSADIYEDTPLENKDDWVQYSFNYQNAALGKYPFIQVMDYQGGEIFLDDASLNETRLAEGDPPYFRANLRIGDGTIIADPNGNLYPASGGSGSFGIASTPFESLYLKNAAIDKSGNTTIGGKLDITGTTTFTGNIKFSGTVETGLTPATHNAYDLGTSSYRWRNLFLSNNATIGGALTVGGQTTFADGSVSEPSITFTNDANTGLYRAGADILAITTGGTERWRINASGHLLAGTDNSYDIGATGATRPRSGYFGTSVVIGDTVTIDATSITGSTTLTINSTGANALTLDSTTTGTVNLGTGNSGKTINVGTGTGADTINIGTGGTGADTITIGSSASTTSLALTTGTGSQTFTSNVASGTTTTSGFVLDATAITSGTGLYLVSDSVTTGRLLDIATSGNTWTGNATTNGLINLASSSTGGTGSSSSVLLNLARSGANANATHTAYGLYSAVTNTGTTSTNIGGYFTASGATNNYGLIVNAGNVGIGITTPGSAYMLDIVNTAATSSTIHLGFAATHGMYISGVESNEGLIGFGAEATFSGGVISAWTARQTSASAIWSDNADIAFYADTGLTTGNTFTPTARLFIKSDGFIGINDASPDALLDIDSTDTNGGDFLITNTGIGTSGSVAQITSNSTTEGDIFTISATGLTTGTALTLTGPSSTGVTDHFAKFTTDVGSAAALIYGAPDFSGSAVTGYGLNITATDATTAANTDYAGYFSMTASGALASGTQNIYGMYSAATSSNVAGGTENVYAGYFKSGGTVASGTINAYGIYVANGTMNTTGTSAQYGLHFEALSGADTNIDINAVTSLDLGVGGTSEITLDGTSFSPTTSDGNALGTTALMWADLFLASGGVINFNNGDVTLTHGTDLLTLAGGDLDITLPAGSNVLINASTTANTTTAGVIDLNVTSATDSNRGLDIAYTHTATGATTSYSAYNAWSSTAVVAGAAVSQTGYGLYNTATKTGADTATGTYSLYGLYSTASNTGRTDAGTVNTYGGYFDATGDASGTSSVFGVYIADVSGGDTNVGLCFDCDGTYSASTVASGIQFGTDANAVTLYRSANDVLRTGDGLTVDLDLIVSGGDITGTGDESIDIGEATANAITLLIDAAGEVILTSAALSPSTSDGNALGTTALMWADLFLASGGVINFNNGDVTLTHGTDLLTLAGGDLDITLPAGSNVLVNASSTANTTTTGVIDLNVSSATDSNRGLDIAYTHTATGATTSYSAYNAWASTAVVTGVAVSQTGYGLYNTATKTGADTATGTYSLYGLYSTASNTGRTDAGTVNTYGGYFDATGDTAGTSSVFGLYLADVSGGDTNVALCFDCDGTYSASTVASGIQFGTDANAVTLYRSANDVLRTGDGLTVDLDLIVSGGDITGTGDESIDIGEATANAITLLIDAAGEVILTSAALSPSTSDGSALGTTALMWADLFLASGGVINFNNGDVTLTHSTDALTLAGGQFLAPLGSVSLPPYSFTGDPNTGIYSSTADTLDIAAGGSRMMSFTNSGCCPITSYYNISMGTKFIGSTSLHGSIDFGDNGAAYSARITNSDNTWTSNVLRLIPQAVVSGGGQTTFTAETKWLDIASQTINFAGNVTTQRQVYIQPATYVGSGAAYTVTNAYGLYVDPSTSGANMTITNLYGIGAGAAATIAGGASTKYAAINIPAHTITDSTTTQITSSPAAAGLSIGQITVAQSGGAVTVDNAASLYIAAAPTAGASVTLTNPYALWVDAGAVRLDGFLNMGNWADSTQTAVSAQGWAQNIAADTQNFSNASSTVAIGATTALGIATLTGDNATLTFTDAATLYIAGIPVASTNVAITNTALALWVDAGTSRFDGPLQLSVPGAAGTDYINFAQSGGGTVAIEQHSSGWTSFNVSSARLYFGDDFYYTGAQVFNAVNGGATLGWSLGGANWKADSNIGNLFVYGDGTSPAVQATTDARSGGIVTLGITGGAHTAVIAEQNLVDVAAQTITITGGFAAQDFLEINQPTISAATSLTVTTANTMAITGAPTVASSGIITNAYGLQVGGATTIAGAASTTYGAIDIPAHTVTTNTTTQITSSPAAAGMRIGQITVAQSGGAVTVDNAASLYIAAAPTAGTSVTLTNPYALWVDAGAARFDGPVAFGAQQTLTANSTTPAVSAGSHWVTANTTNPTLISNFTSGFSGQILVVELGDSVTDFDCTASNLNCGGADITTGATGDIFTFVYDGTNWNLINWMDTSATQIGADVAEWYVSSESLEPGDVVSVTPQEDALVEKSKTSYDQKTLGIVSTAPGLILGEETQFTFPVALAGRVPVKVSTENGPIEKGDYLTSSSTPGVAMKATRPGQVVGKALEPFGSGDELLVHGSLTDSTTNNELQASESERTTNQFGKILAFVNVSYAFPNDALASSTITILDEQGTTSIGLTNQNGKLLIANAQGIPTIALDPETGSAFFSGTLAAKVIRAERIEGLEIYTNRIASLEQRVREASAPANQQTSSSEKSDLAELLINRYTDLLNTASSSAELKLDNLTAVFSLRSIGETFLAKTNIAGSLTVGTITFDDLDQSISAIGTLKLQNSSLAEAVDLFNGKIKLSRDGNIEIEGLLIAKKVQTEELVVVQNQTLGVATTSATLNASSSATLANRSIGDGIIKAGTTFITITTNKVKSTSKIFVTPTTLTSQSLVVTAKVEGTSFTVSLEQPPSSDISFDWWIVQTESVAKN